MQLSGHRPGQLAAQFRERVLAVGGELVDALERAPQFAHQFLEAALLILEPRELARAVLRFGFERHQRTAAAFARRLQPRQLAFLLFLERREPRFFLGQRRVERGELGDVRVDGGDLVWRVRGRNTGSR